MKIVETLGAGNFGEVSKAILSETVGLPGYIVAVKVLKLTSTDSFTARDQLLSEASLMVQFDNANVVRLIGVVTAGDPLLVILEFCEKGSLDSYLEKKGDIELDTQLKFALDCGKGMKYLASLKFIHRDLAARNVLLGSDLGAKIADFGLSRVAVDKNYYQGKGGQIPVRWTAPEALEHQRFTEKSDVWSFGILLFEIFTQAMMPYLGWNNAKVWVEVLGGYRLPCPLTCPHEVHQLMLSCWLEAALRPDFVTLVARLEEIQKHASTLIVPVKGPKAQITTSTTFIKPVQKPSRTVQTQTELVAASPVIDVTDASFKKTDVHFVDMGALVETKATLLTYTQPDVPPANAYSEKPPSAATGAKTKSQLVYTEPDQAPEVKKPLVYMIPDNHTAIGNAYVENPSALVKNPSITSKYSTTSAEISKRNSSSK